jgi:hypothetical protein
MLPSKLRFHFGYHVSLLALLALGACSGGGGMDGNSTDPTNPMPSPSGQATVGVLLTDAPGTSFSEANATITGITLMGRGSPQTVFSGSNTIDLLKLDSSSDLFALSTSVAPGSFQKIRLTLSDLELVRRDAAGNVVERVHPNLPGNGKLDLNLQNSMSASAGDTLLLELDFDMQKSIQIVSAGASGRVNFRPVIFVRLLQKSLNGRLARVAGTIGTIDATALTFQLCDLVRNVPEATTRSSSGSDDRMGNHCIEVATDDKTAVFGADGAAVTFADLKAGDPVTAIGRISKQDDDDQGEDDSGSGSSGNSSGMGSMGTMGSMGHAGPEQRLRQQCQHERAPRRRPAPRCGRDRSGPARQFCAREGHDQDSTGCDDQALRLGRRRRTGLRTRHRDQHPGAGHDPDLRARRHRTDDRRHQGGSGGARRRRVAAVEH